MSEKKYYESLSPEAKEARRKYTREYARNRYANDPEYRQRCLANSRRFWEKKALENAQREDAQSGND